MYVYCFQVYEHGFSALKLQKDICDGPTMLLMEFPESFSSYFLLMQLDKDFKPLFKLLETGGDISERLLSFANLSRVIRFINVDIDQIQVLEDELNYSLLDPVKLLSLSATDVGTNRLSENKLQSEFRIRGANVNTGLPSSFSSIVDEVFGLGKGSLATSFSIQTATSVPNIFTASHIGSIPASLHSVKTGTSSPNWEVGSPNVTPNSSNSSYLSSNLKSLTQSGSASLPSSGPGRITTVKKISASKSDQDLSSLRSPHSADVGLYTKTDEDLLMTGKRSVRVPRPTVPQAFMSSPKLKVAGSLSVSRSNSWVTPTCKIPFL